MPRFSRPRVLDFIVLSDEMSEASEATVGEDLLYRCFPSRSRSASTAEMIMFYEARAVLE